MVKRPWCLGMVLLLGVQIVLTAGFRDGKDGKSSALELAVEKGTNIELKGTVSLREEKANVQVYYLTDNQVCLNDQILKESKILVYVKQEKSQTKKLQTERTETKKTKAEKLQTERTQTKEIQTEGEQTEGIETEGAQKIEIGNQISVKGKVDYFESARNPGNFDQEFYYQRQGIRACIWADEVKIAKRQVRSFRENLCVVRSRWRELLIEFLGEEAGNSMSAILLGEKNGLDPEVKELYQKGGIGHILAISGLHLSFIGIGMYQVLRRFTGSYFAGGILGILFLVLYILMIGFTVSVIRALVMFLFRVGADMAGRHYDAPTALSTAAVAVLLWQPLSLYDGGFWLSFGAVAAILAVVPVVQEDISIHTLRSNGQKLKTRMIVQEKMSVHASRSTNVSYSSFVRMLGSGKAGVQSSLRRNRKEHSLFIYLREVWEHVWKGIFKGLMASMGINLILFPIQLCYFYEFPLYSFILNLVVIPLMSVLLFLGMIGSVFALWLVPVSAVLFWMCSKILWIYKMSCEITLGLPGARLVIGRPDMWQIAVYYGIMFLGLILLRYMILSIKMQEMQKEQREKGNHADLRNRGNQRGQKEAQSGSFNGNVASIDQIEFSRDSKNRKKKPIAVFFLWAVGIMILSIRFGEAGKLTTAVLDVGQGDGIFMKGPKGNTYLVDGGSSDVKKVGQYRLEPFLKSQGVGKLDYVLISHGDSDHMNGVEELIERQDVGVRIGTLVLPAKEMWDEALEELAGKARNHGIRVVVIEPGQSIREGEMVLTCIQPGNVEMKSEDAKLRQENAVPGTGNEGVEPGNEALMVLAVQYGEFDMLLTGDVEGEGEMQLTKTLEEQYEGCEWEVLKVAHHGSKNSSTEEFLHQVQPAYSLISAGQENRYGHPHQETIKRLADVGSKIYSTQENGAIIVEVEGGELLRMEKWQR